MTSKKGKKSGTRGAHEAGSQMESSDLQVTILRFEESFKL